MTGVPAVDTSSPSPDGCNVSKPDARQAETTGEGQGPSPVVCSVVGAYHPPGWSQVAV
jgi:hypothetical protein